jgi:hypothetical protein
VKGDPSGLRERATIDQKLRDICIVVGQEAFAIEMASNCGAKFTAPVSPGHIEQWRDYEKKYSQVIGEIFAAHALGVSMDAVPSRPPELYEAQRIRIEGRSKDDVDKLDHVFDFVDQIDTSFWEEDHDDALERGIATWRQLRSHVLRDLVGIIRRRAFVPFVLIPKNVSDAHGSAEKLSLFTNLHEAQEAFVYGLPFACISMMRSVIETVVRDCYGSSGIDLEERIKNAKLRGVTHVELQQIRKLANAVLHLQHDNVQVPIDLERRLITHLRVVRKLIENTPPRSP